MSSRLKLPRTTSLRPRPSYRTRTFGARRRRPTRQAHRRCSASCTLHIDAAHTAPTHIAVNIQLFGRACCRGKSQYRLPQSFRLRAVSRARAHTQLGPQQRLFEDALALASAQQPAARLYVTPDTRAGASLVLGLVTRLTPAMLWLPPFFL